MAGQGRHDPGARRATAGRRLRRVLGDGLFAGGLAVVASLLLCWPFLRTPQLDASAALVYVFGVWAAFIVVLAAMMRARPGAPRGGGR